MEQEIPELGTYKHKRGGLYEVIAIARHSEDCLNRLVVYESLTDSDFPTGTIWIRELEEFMKPGRFTKVEY